MYVILYRDQLLPGKKMSDFKDWLIEYYPIHQKWGAIDVKVLLPLYEETGLFYVLYSFESLDKWNSGLTSEEGERLLNSLGKVIDLGKTICSVMVDISG